MTTAQQINIFNLRYTNITPVANMYARNTEGINSAVAKPKKTRYKTVHQLVTECPLLGSTKYGMNFIA